MSVLPLMSFACPVVDVVIAAPAGWVSMGGESRQLGLPLVAFRRGVAIVDTGAERSVVRADVCDALGLPRSLPVALRGVSAPGRVARGVDAQTTLRRAEVTVVERTFSLDVVAAEVAHEGAVMLVGMDILSLGRLVFDGPRGVLVLRFEGVGGVDAMGVARRPVARAEGVGRVRSVG